MKGGRDHKAMYAVDATNDRDCQSPISMLQRPKVGNRNGRNSSCPEMFVSLENDLLVVYAVVSGKVVKITGRYKQVESERRLMYCTCDVRGELLKWRNAVAVLLL
jgi:hypothetical protein